MLSAVLWAARVQARTVIWSDALHVVDNMQLLLQGSLVVDDLENCDLWHRMSAAVERLGETEVQVLYTPSHLDACACESPMEEWLAQWNDHADTVAVLANLNRSQALSALHQRALEYHEDMQAVLRAYRSLLLCCGCPHGKCRSTHQGGACGGMRGHDRFRYSPAGR